MSLISKSQTNWNLSIPAAIELQKELSKQLILEDSDTEVRMIAGADVALSPNGDEAVAGIIMYEFPILKEIDRVFSTAPLRFPYIPGLLSFRECPILLKAFEKLKKFPDLIIFDGQGIAHPRRLGIASHMGLILNLPTIGCAKSLLCGTYTEPALENGSSSSLTYKGQEVGIALRMREGVKPVFISPGHKISLKTAVEITRQCDSGFRIPKPTREADRFVGQLKKEIWPPPPSL